MPRGRPSKLTPEARKIICDAVAACVPLQVAAALAKVSRSTIHQWTQRHPDFADDLKRASAQAEKHLVGVIRRAAQKQWTAAAWLLERHPKYRERWLKISSPGAQTISTTPVISVRPKDENPQSS
jgi:hypothetical protein